MLKQMDDTAAHWHHDGDGVFFSTSHMSKWMLAELDIVRASASSNSSDPVDVVEQQCSLVGGGSASVCSQEHKRRLRRWRNWPHSAQRN